MEAVSLSWRAMIISSATSNTTHRPARADMVAIVEQKSFGRGARGRKKKSIVTKIIGFVRTWLARRSPPRAPLSPSLLWKLTSPRILTALRITIAPFFLCSRRRSAAPIPSALALCSLSLPAPPAGRPSRRVNFWLDWNNLLIPRRVTESNGGILSSGLWPWRLEGRNARLPPCSKCRDMHRSFTKPCSIRFQRALLLITLSSIYQRCCLKNSYAPFLLV